MIRHDYYKNDSIDPCFWAMGGWNGIGSPADNGSLVWLYLPSTPQETTYYLVFDNTKVTAVSMWEKDIETQYDDHPSGGFAEGDKEIQVRYKIDFSHLTGDIYVTGPEIYKLIVEEENKPNSSVKNTPGFELVGLIAIVVIVIGAGKRK